MRRELAVGLGGLVLVLVGAARSSRADELSELEKAQSAFAAHKYPDAEQRLRKLLDGGGLKNPDQLADARMYLGASLWAEGKKDEATGVFRTLLLDKGDYRPDQLLIPLDTIYALIDVRTQIRDEMREAEKKKVQQEVDEKKKIAEEKRKIEQRQALLEKLASEQIVIKHNSRWLALLPFGVGQFQNRQPVAGWTFLVSESLLVAASAVSAGLTIYNVANANTALRDGQGNRAVGFHERAVGDWTADVVFTSAFFGVAATGIVLAQTGFVAEQTEVRHRALPPLSVTPVVGPGSVGVVIRF